VTSNDDASVQAEIMRLHYLEGLSLRAIARRLHVARKTVRRALGRRLPVAATDNGRRPSLLDGYDAVIQKWLLDTPELNATQVLERLRPHGYTGGISILRERVRCLRPLPAPKAYLTVAYQPGACVQVDWADFGFALPGVPRRISAFVALMAYSRKLYVEFVLSQATGSFLRCMDRALEFFGGVTSTDVFDNMKTVVLEHRPGMKPRFNERFLAYANTRGGFAVIACTPGHPEGKGGVERGVRTVRETFWPGRRFRDLDDLNAQVTDWRNRIHNHRPNETTGKVPSLVFEHEERPHLKPIPTVPFDTDDIEHEIVSPTFRVRFDRNTYSVPWHLQGQHVGVRGNDRLVRIFLGPKCVATHERSWSTGADVEDPSHPRDLREFRRTQPKDALVARFGDVGSAYFEVMSAGRRSLRRELLRLTYLAELFTAAQTRSAMQTVMRSGHVGVEYVEYVLRHKRRLEPAYTPLELGIPALDGIVLREPDLSIYDPPAITRDPGGSDEDAHEG
jgi:transposase